MRVPQLLGILCFRHFDLHVNFSPSNQPFVRGRAYRGITQFTPHMGRYWRDNNWHHLFSPLPQSYRTFSQETIVVLERGKWGSLVKNTPGNGQNTRQTMRQGNARSNTHTDHALQRERHNLVVACLPLSAGWFSFLNVLLSGDRPFSPSLAPAPTTSGCRPLFCPVIVVEHPCPPSPTPQGEP